MIVASFFTSRPFDLWETKQCWPGHQLCTCSVTSQQSHALPAEFVSILVPHSTSDSVRSGHENTLVFAATKAVSLSLELSCPKLQRLTKGRLLATLSWHFGGPQAGISPSYAMSRGSCPCSGRADCRYHAICRARGAWQCEGPFQAGGPKTTADLLCMT